MINVVRRFVPTILARSSAVTNLLSYELQQQRGIRVEVRYGNLEQSLNFMQKKMQWSGMERLIKSEEARHIKNSEKRVQARKARERKVRSRELASKLKTILGKNVRDK